MISEGIHSVIDSSSQLLLLWGLRLSRRRPDENRPFGYGREFYFWSFIVSLIIFVVGGCISFYEGLIRMHNPFFEGSVAWNYGILAIALIFTSVSLVTALKAFNKERSKTPFFKAIINSKDPSTFITLLGDAGDVLGIFIAFAGIFLGRYYHNPHYDGIASMVIGLMLIFISLILVRESKSLLMGETTSRRTLRRVVTIAEADDAVLKVKKHFSMYLSPEEVILQLNTVFREDLTTVQITDAIDRIVHQIRKEFPRMKQIFIEPVPMKKRR
jgi:cation diffusion facilitator family transporter